MVESMVYIRNWPTGFSDRRWNRNVVNPREVKMPVTEMMRRIVDSEEDGSPGVFFSRLFQWVDVMKNGVVTAISSSKMMISMGFLWIYGIKNGDFMGIDQ